MEAKDKKIEETKKQAMGCVKNLFSFERYFFLDFLFYIHIVVQIVIILTYMYTVFSSGDLLKIIGGVAIYPLIFLYVRFVFEFLSVLFSMNKNLVSIKKSLKK